MSNEIESTLELPYKLIDICRGYEHFVFTFKRFDENQSEYSIKNGGVTGDFEISYECKGVKCNFECDITIGNLYYFYIELDNAYQCCKNSIAILNNYGETLNRTKLTFRFDKLGHCFISGFFKNKENSYRSGIIFDDIEIDQTYIPEILVSLENFFTELKRIQGHSNFY
ncbi:MAG: hypothetical protein Q4A05_05610 [Ruminococcus sp.]|nr:hypothetical protein [Ruminococcus sp.]